MSGYLYYLVCTMFAWPIDWLSFLWVKWLSKFISFFFKCDFACVFCMITGMLFVYVNVCLYLNVSFVILYMLLYKGPRGRQQSWSFNVLILTFIWISDVNLPYICFLYMKIKNKFYYILLYSILVNLYQVVVGQQSVRILFKSLAQLFL